LKKSTTASSFESSASFSSVDLSSRTTKTV
jgi:hypothetical protein